MAKKKSEQKKGEEKKEVRKSIGSCKSFPELQDFLKKAGKERITNALDLAMLKPSTYDDLLKLMETKREEFEAREFRTKSRIKAHIKFRETHDNWIFSKEGEVVQLIGKE